MSAEDALHAELFHGTNQRIPVGKPVLPALEAKVESHWGKTGEMFGQPSRENAFATTDEGIAWRFAQHAAAGLVQARGADKRARVYRVAPNPQMRPGAHTELKEYVAPAFDTKEVIDIKPGHQGTFPEVNWRRHSTLPVTSEYDPNHPAPSQSSSAFGAVGKQMNAVAEYADHGGESPGQEPLFRHLPHYSFSDHQLARNAILRSLVNAGAAPAIRPTRRDY